MNLKSKKVLLRVDFNVPFEYRVESTLPTIRSILKRGGRVILATHADQNGHVLHLDTLARFLQKHFPSLSFVKGNIKRPPPDFFGKRKTKVFLLDNLRLNPGETANDLRFAKLLASWGDYYINDAFAVSHRDHASIVLLPKLLPHQAGPLLKKEVLELSRFFEPQHPFLLILAGKKFETKEPLIAKFIKNADAIFIGGALANTFLARRGFDVGKSKVEDVKIPQSILWSHKIFLPEDWVADCGVIYDAGPKTIRMLSELAKKAKFILWNGTLGLCEKGFDKGTRDLAKALGKSKAYKVVGGGDTVAAIRKLRLEKNFDFISTGGGAMLEFLAKGTLPGIEALKKR